MVVARIQGAALFAHAGGVRTAGSITRVHGSAGTVVIYTAPSFGTTWQELFKVKPTIFRVWLKQARCGNRLRKPTVSEPQRIASLESASRPACLRSPLGSRHRHIPPAGGRSQ